jgi:hypothetical protein
MRRLGYRTWVRTLFLCAFVPVSVARAETPAAPGGRDVIVPLGKGATAPFSGQLFDAPTALRWGLWIRNYKELAAAEAQQAKGICEADLSYKDDLLKIEQDKTHTLVTDLQKRLLATDTERVKLRFELDHPPWYSSVWFGVGVGVVSTTALVLVGSQAF